MVQRYNSPYLKKERCKGFRNQTLSRNAGLCACQVKHKIELLGFGYLLEYLDVNVDLLPILNQRYTDQFLQEWSM